jgi:hypothetical protein
MTPHEQQACLPISWFLNLSSHKKTRIPQRKGSAWDWKKNHKYEPGTSYNPESKKVLKQNIHTQANIDEAVSKDKRSLKELRKKGREGGREGGREEGEGRKEGRKGGRKEEI